MKDLNEKAVAAAFGKRVKMLRLMTGISREKLVEELECSLRTLEKVEHGDRMMKTWRQIRFCRICNVSMDYLLRGIDGSDLEDVPVRVVEMYKEADSEELDILQKHMRSAEDEISRKRRIIEKYASLAEKPGTDKNPEEQITN